MFARLTAYLHDSGARFRPRRGWLVASAAAAQLEYVLLLGMVSGICFCNLDYAFGGNRLNLVLTGLDPPGGGSGIQEPVANDPALPKDAPESDACPAGSQTVERNRSFSGKGNLFFVVPECVDAVRVQAWGGDDEDWMCADGHHPYAERLLSVAPAEILSIKFNKGAGGHNSNQDEATGGGRKVGHFQVVVSREDNLVAVAIGEGAGATPYECVPSGNDEGLVVITWREPA